MKTILKRILSAAMALALVSTLSVGALAADDPGVRVQLGDKPVSFTDAAPVIQNGRTFVPFRAVFEALGAEVGYEDATRTVTAVRGDTTVQFVVGEKSMKITENGETQTVEIDAASYIQNGRTMVPVRFAAQALGCIVGWDADDKTVLILDPDSLFQGEYTLMDKYIEYQRGLQENPYSLSGDFNLNLTASENGTTLPFSMTGKIDVLGDKSGAEAQLALSIDTESLLAAVGVTDKPDEQTEALLNMLKELNIEYIVNYESGMLYMRSPLLSLFLGATDSNAWISVDLNEALKSSGMNFSALIESAYGTGGFKDSMISSLRIIPLTDKDAAARLYEQMSLFSSLYADANFTKSGDTYKNSINYDQDGQSSSMTLSITLKNDKVTAFSMDVSTTAKIDTGTYTSTVSYKMERNHIEISMKMDMPDILTMEFSGSFDYAATSKTPARAPEDGSTIVPFPAQSSSALPQE